MPDSFKLSCVLFDLDGTLVDTAPDLIACLNVALNQHGLPSALPEKIKPFISYGANAMITASLPAPVDAHKQQQILDDLHNCYLSNIAGHSRFFSGMAETLDVIEGLGLKWGVVTNKLERFTLPLMDALRLTGRASCIISGDTAAKPKPYPEPMWAACRQAGVRSEECVYIGDAVHDIAAGKNARMKTLAALYGYLKPDDKPETWGADDLVESPQHISQWIESHTCH
ncbi:MAG: HAD family hydrolase [Gammaproteobacteria bacterium]